MNTIRVAVCDDDKTCLDEECRLLGEAFGEKEIHADIHAYTSPEKLTASNERYDIVFLDVEMSEMSGIEAADKILAANKSTLIFFVTNHEGYMDAALNRRAFRFWVKPLNRQRLLYGIESAMNEITARGAYLNVTVNHRLCRIAVEDIIFAYAENKMTTIVTAREKLCVKRAFREISAELDGGDFCRTHASYIVNMKYVVKYTASEVICRAEGKLYTAYMSKRRYQYFVKRFLEWTGEVIC